MSRIKCRCCSEYCGGKKTSQTPKIRASTPYGNVCTDCILQEWKHRVFGWLLTGHSLENLCVKTKEPMTFFGDYGDVPYLPEELKAQAPSIDELRKEQDEYFKRVFDPSEVEVVSMQYTCV